MRSPAPRRLRRVSQGGGPVRWAGKRRHLILPPQPALAVLIVLPLDVHPGHPGGSVLATVLVGGGVASDIAMNRRGWDDLSSPPPILGGTECQETGTGPMSRRRRLRGRRGNVVHRRRICDGRCLLVGKDEAEVALPGADVPEPVWAGDTDHPRIRLVIGGWDPNSDQIPGLGSGGYLRNEATAELVLLLIGLGVFALRIRRDLGIRRGGKGVLGGPRTWLDCCSLSHDAVVAYFGRTDGILGINAILQHTGDIILVVFVATPKQIQPKGIAVPGLLHELNDVSEDKLVAHLHRLDVEYDVSVDGHDNVVLLGDRIAIAIAAVTVTVTVTTDRWRYRGRLPDERVRARGLGVGLDEIETEARLGIVRVGAGHDDISDQSPAALWLGVRQIAVTTGNDGVVFLVVARHFPLPVSCHSTTATGDLGRLIVGVSGIVHPTRMRWQAKKVLMCRKGCVWCAGRKS